MHAWYLRLQTHTQVCNTSCFSAATLVAWTRLIVTLYVYWPYLLTYSLTYSIEQSPSLEAKPQLIKNFPVFCGNRRFIAAFTCTRNQSLSWPRSIQSVPSLLPSTPGSSEWSLSPLKPCMRLSCHLHVLRTPPKSFFSNNNCWGVQPMKLLGL